jgi:hypothetical protein
MQQNVPSVALPFENYIVISNVCFPSTNSQNHVEKI